MGKDRVWATARLAECIKVSLRVGSVRAPECARGRVALAKEGQRWAAKCSVRAKQQVRGKGARSDKVTAWGLDLEALRANVNVWVAE